MVKNRIARTLYFLVVSLFLLGVYSCEKDIENVGVDLVNNGRFQVGDTVFEVVAYTINVDSSRVDNNEVLGQPGYLIGVNNNQNFGYLKSNLVTQFRLPSLGVNFGDNAIIDMVVLDIPYYSTRDTIQYAKDPLTGEEIKDSDGNPIVAPSFSLDSIYGNKDLPYQIRISELGTFLNVLDPENPTQPKKYYSNRDYTVLDELFYGEFKPNRNDTVLYVERRYLDGDPSTVNDIDTIKTETANPSIKFELNKDFFKTRFVDQDDSPFFDNFENFVRYFKGIYIESIGPDGSLMNLPITNGGMTIYYTFEEIKDESTGEDLNYNGVTGETDVLVKTKSSMKFDIGGARSGVYQRDYSSSPAGMAMSTPNKVEGESTLYVQGAAGSEAIIQLFTEESLEDLRSQGLLINEANLTFYVDDIKQSGKLPSRLFLYNYTENSVLRDLRLDGFDVFDGSLSYDSDGNPEKYKFRITRFVSRILSESGYSDAKLALKTYHRTDDPFTNLDTLVADYSWIPKGVTLNGNLPQLSDKRLKLEIFYSK
ncbi:DUF4270 domain-containing protein [Namhaeicola litoreus]|uniref:DUF4270 domain-containing protein n=1 Tax=Namhaeicola litoreus TaxID=1052145 RepID=A0ABW3XZ14_9FLAO